MTKEDILEELERRKTYYAALHEAQKEDNKFYELKFEARIPDVGWQITPPTAREWIDNGINDFTLDNPKVIPFPREESSKKDAALQEFYNFWMHLEILKIKQNALKLLLRGESFFRVWFDDMYFGVDVAKDENLKKKRLFHFPLQISVPDPINVFCSPAQNGFVPVDVIESYKITVAEALNLCNLYGWKWKTEKNLTEYVEWVSYISAEQRCFILDKESVLKKPNILGFCPYVHIPAGYGQSSYEGNPAEEYRSVLYSKRDLMRAECRTLSQLDSMNARYAWANIKLKGEDTDIMELYGERKVSLNPDKPIRENDRVSVEVMEGQSPPPGAYQHLATISSRARPSQTYGGQRPQGVYSGQLFEDIHSTAKVNYKNAFKNLEDGLAIVCGMGARIIEKTLQYPVGLKNFAGDKIHVSKITPAEIDGNYDCKVVLLADSPEASTIKKSMGDTAKQSQIISHKTDLVEFWDYSEKQADREIARIHAEQAILRNPQLQNAVGLAAIERFGVEEAKKEIEEKGVEGTHTPPIRQPATQPLATEGVPSRPMPGAENLPTRTELEI